MEKAWTNVSVCRKKHWMVVGYTPSFVATGGTVSELTLHAMTLMNQNIVTCNVMLVAVQMTFATGQTVLEASYGWHLPSWFLLQSIGYSESKYCDFVSTCSTKTLYTFKNCKLLEHRALYNVQSDMQEQNALLSSHYPDS